MDKKRLLLFSRDPGGANTLIPLVNVLKNKGYKVELYGKDFALKRYNLFSLEGIDILKEVSFISLESILDFIRMKNPDLILTGTSADDPTEKYFWKGTEILKIPSVAILDNWVNYGVRFSKYNVSEIDKYQLSEDQNQKYIPSKIFVMDDLAKNEMINDKIDPKKIVVTGHPYFDLILKRQKKLNQKQQLNIRSYLMKDASNFLLTFVSEPITFAYGENYLGYTEKTIFINLYRSLEIILNYFDREIILVLKLHPKEKADSFFDLLNKFKNPRIKIVVDKDINSWDLICCSDLVCGMNSILLLEAVILCRKILSIQIGLNNKKQFVLNERGLVKRILDFDELVFNLKSIIIDKKYEYTDFEIIKDPVKNVISEVKKILKD